MGDIKIFLAGVLLLLAIGHSGAVARAADADAVAGPQLAELRCEYLVDPLGIDETQPRLSWVMESKRRGERQTAYQLLVASAQDVLAKDQGDLWDSGKVESSDSGQIVYAGKALGSRQACYWKVRVWDRDDKPTGYSSPALWTMGLLDAVDWHAKWIDAEGLAKAGAPAAIIINHATYEARDGAGATDVTALLSGLVKDGRLEVAVDNKMLGKDPALNHVKQLRVEYEAGGSKHVATVAENDTLTLPEGSHSVPYLRKSFAVAKAVRSATLYATALGLYELHINGQRVGDHALAPDWTDYNKRVRYQAYDVTPLVKQGNNAIAGLLANGWYCGHIGNGGYRVWGKVPALLAQLEITYADGSVERVVTDETWKVHGSPVQSSDFMQGESYDAQQEIADWDQPGLDESTWVAATPRTEPERQFDAQVMEPVRVTDELKPRNISEPIPGHFVFDMGQNMVGVVRLNVTAQAGTKITIRHAEMLNPDGTIYTDNLRGAPSIDTYVCKGAFHLAPGDLVPSNIPEAEARMMTVAVREPEIWQPQFTFHGFRYVELTGLPAKPALDAITGVVLGSDTPRTGEFSCSDARINQLFSNIQWGQRGNYLSVPTDCPQRDERLGWMGDAEVFVRTATKNSDVAAFFTKWLVDVDDAQSVEGAFSDVSPKSSGGGGTPAWGDAGVICPWTIYQAYGDKRILERHLPAMIKWVEWCRDHSTGLIRSKNRGGDYGDWLAIGANTPKELIGTAYFAYSTHLVAAACKVTGKADDAAKYEALFADIKAAFNKKYVAPDGRIQGNTQCSYAMALQFDLLPTELRPKAAQYLEEGITAKGGHLSTGFVGVSYLLPVLTREDKVPAAYGLLMQDTFPSWLFSVKQGATTIWERWDGWTPEKGFQDPGMNSFNHYALGSCGQWLYEGIAGVNVDPDKPGYEHIIIRPYPGGGLQWAKGSIHSMRGQIVSGWTLGDHALNLNITIPPNTTATVYVPAADANKVLEFGRPLTQAEGVTFLRMEDGAAVFEVESGQYALVAPM